MSVSVVLNELPSACSARDFRGNYSIRNSPFAETRESS
jgi:hypothetical protein